MRSREMPPARPRRPPQSRQSRPLRLGPRRRSVPASWLHQVGLVLLLGAAGASSASRQQVVEQRNYAGYKLLQAVPQTLAQVAQLRGLMQLEESQVKRQNHSIEFWREPSNLNAPVDIMVSPEAEDEFRAQLRHWRIPVKTLLYDIGESVERSRPAGGGPQASANRQTAAAQLRDPKVFFSDFRRLAEIEAKLRDLATDPRVTLERPALSHERRPLHLVKVSTDPLAEKPIIFIDAGHHAREWISHSTVMYLIEALVNDNMPVAYSRHLLEPARNLSEGRQQPRDQSAPTATPSALSLSGLLARYDFWFVPVVNPDGYEWSHKRDRMWRKSRSRRNNDYCTGVDLNRNYQHHWMESGASRDPCSDIYAGPRSFSEPESAFIASLLERNKRRIKMYLSLHSYGKYLLLPYGYSRALPPTYKQMMRVAETGAEAIRKVRGTVYKCGSAARLLYEAAGGSDDYAYGEAKIPYVYTMELPGGDGWFQGFVIEASKIVAVGQETAVGLRAMVGAIGGGGVDSVPPPSDGEPGATGGEIDDNNELPAAAAAAAAATGTPGGGGASARTLLADGQAPQAQTQARAAPLQRPANESSSTAADSLFNSLNYLRLPLHVNDLMSDRDELANSDDEELDDEAADE